MDFIAPVPTESTAESWLTFIALLCGVFTILSLVICGLAGSWKGLFVPAILSIGVLWPALHINLVIDPQQAAEQAEYERQWTEQVRDTYGIEAPWEDLSKLVPYGDPSGRKPTVYGATELITDRDPITVQRVVMAWDGDELVLATGADETKLTELPRMER